MRIELSRLHKELGSDDDLRDPRPGRGDDHGRPDCGVHQGKIAQLGAPMDLYQQPANAFVAGFIGSPRMNFIARPGADGAAAHRALWQQLAGDTSLAQQVGIRPEHLRLAPAGQGIDATVELTEQLGDASIVHLRLQGLDHLLVAKQGSGHARLPDGQTVGLVLGRRRCRTGV